jgi:hypothetical protein
MHVVWGRGAGSDARLPKALASLLQCCIALHACVCVRACGQVGDYVMDVAFIDPTHAYAIVQDYLTGEAAIAEYK